MGEASTVRLPGGVWRTGTRHTDVRIRAPRGHEEVWLAANSGERPNALATNLLQRCVLDLACAGSRAERDSLHTHEGGGPSRVDASAIDALTVGDREALLWHLRRLAFGDQVDAVVECTSCGEKLDVSFTVGELLAEPYDDWGEVFTDQVGPLSVTYRLPTGADVGAGTVGELMASCIVAVDGAGVTDEVISQLADPLGELMATRDPQAETRISTTCPACEAEVVAVLDAFSFLREELIRRSVFLLREIHTLAWHYHWTESDILNLTADRRRAYLDLIAEAYESTAP